jgi:superfamily I DNA and/or RNA helicase
VQKEFVMTQVERQLEAARQKLLDLTMRNRLLNYRPSKARTIKVVDEIPKEIYDILVLLERNMQFLPKAKEEESRPEENGDIQLGLEGLREDASDLTEEEASVLWDLPPPDTEVAARHVDRFLQTSLESAALQKRLFYIYQQARSVLEEQGYTVMYLALGFLEWKESPDSLQSRLAPLILIPVELVRTKVRAAMRVRWTGEDIFTNISLQAKLLEHGIALPEFEMPDDKDGIDEYFQSVTRATSNMPEWNVLADICLDFFSFTKFIMYKDLDPKVWPEGMSPADHHLIQAILDPTEGVTLEKGFDESEVDKRLDFRNLYHVMDADPSQIAVIEDIKRSQNLAVEGPPGTGKSQTITNVIAELLAKGKTILFVSEKMAALEVVKSRLDGVGLGDFCLELHSRKTKKKEVLKELERSIQSRSVSLASSEEDFDRLETLKSDLNDYAEALREPFGKLGRSPFALFCLKESARRHFSDAQRDMPRIDISTPELCTQESWTEAINRLTDIAEAVPLVQPVATHPWKGCEPGTVLPADEAEVAKLITECQNALKDLQIRLDSLIEITGIKLAEKPEELPHAINAAKVVAQSTPVDRSVLLNDEWNELNEKAKNLIQEIETYRTELAKVLENFEETVLDLDIATILEEYRALSQKFFRWFHKRYRELKRYVYALYKDRPPRDRNQIILDLEHLTQCIELRQKIRQQSQLGQGLFGSYWRNETSKPSALQSFAEWVVRFRRELLQEILTERSADIISKGIKKKEIIATAKDVVVTGRRFLAARDLLAKRIGANYEKIFGVQAKSVSFSDLSSQFNTWEAEVPKLQRWAQFVALRDACLKTVGNPLVEIIEGDQIEPEDIILCFEGNFADALLRLAFAERSALGTFIGDLHEKKVERFIRLDRELISLNQKRLAHKLYQERPQISSGASLGSEAGILLGEFGRRRGHKPIRKLMALAGGLIQKIKPCFMMSPLSIAQYLDPKTVRFDVIVFDEASQVRPEDALGSLLRGNQVVVMGDTRQLPPTSFFDHIIESTNEEDDDFPALIADVESILHQCKRCFPTKILRWHYRSKHESLVAVSNQEFYDNRLLIYPSAIDKSPNLGLEFVHLQNTVYDRGRSSANRKEARAVAKEAIEHFRVFPEKSLGVGAFNIKQQQAILEEVELQLRLDPEMEDFFSSDREEHFFVKNLETIQGDERDVIFLSIGFGFDEAGRLTRNFGPLNHEGGERRLNVLITRARERCVVFSNFRAGDLRLDANAPFGVRALRLFLDYAENRSLLSIQETREDTDSPFEDSVFDFLRGYGLEVRKQVGCAGFRVDLAVVDPESPGRYLLGIECDGAKYHSSPVARDRDRLRQQILERLGWRIHRVWSTDWYRNRNNCERSILEALEKAKYEKRQTNPFSEDKPTEETIELDKEDLERDDFSPPEIVEESISDTCDYEVCTFLSIEIVGELHKRPIGQLAQAVLDVVNVEGPVHFDEVVRRIRSLWGLKKAGKRIYDAVKKGAAYARRKGCIRKRGDFLWHRADREVRVRLRQGDPPAKIELICDEEIAEAIKLVLKRQFATLPVDLIAQSSRLLGIKRIRAGVEKRVMKVIRKLIKQGALEETPNGMIDFA